MISWPLERDPEPLEADYTQEKERDAKWLFAMNAWAIPCRYCAGEPKPSRCPYNHVPGYSPVCGRSYIEARRI